MRPQVFSRCLNNTQGAAMDQIQNIGYKHSTAQDVRHYGSNNWSLDTERCWPNGLKSLTMSSTREGPIRTRLVSKKSVCEVKGPHEDKTSNQVCVRLTPSESEIQIHAQSPTKARLERKVYARLTPLPQSEVYRSLKTSDPA